MSFREVAIGELERDGCFLHIQDGNHGEKHPKANQYVDEGIPFIMASDLRDGRVDLANANKLPQTVTDKLRIGFCYGGDVLLSHKGSVGYVAIAPEHAPYMMLTPQVTYYRVNEEKLSREFLSYAFRDPRFQARLESAAGQQGTRGYVGITAQRRLLVRYGDRDSQARLVEMLKPYDALIENNRKRIELLEEAARLLYREWFVRLQFPGREHTGLREGVPEGWTRQPLSVCADIVMGQSPESRFYNESGEGLPFHQGVTDYGFRYVTHRTYSTSLTRRAEPGDILISVRAPVGRINVTRDRIVLGRGLAAVRSRSGHQSFLFYSLKNHFHTEDLIGTGAIFAATNKKELEGQMLLMPAEALLNAFEQQARVIDRQISCLTAQIDKLTQARDLLLPRLMNGEIAV